MKIKLMLPGIPIPKHRPRFMKTGHTYDDQYKIVEEVSILMNLQSNLIKPYASSVKLRASFFMPIPKSLSKTKRGNLIDTPHSKRPDIDNLLKFYCDCIVKARNIITDDAIIAEIQAVKVYSLSPLTILELTAL